MTPHRRSRNAAGSGKSPAPSEVGLLVCCEIETFMASGYGVPTIALVSERLSMHVRTLQRRLAEEQLAFRDLLGVCRRRHAVAALSAGHLPIAEIAAQLGYSDPAHFARAFRAWTGRTPSSYRNMRRQASNGSG